MYSAVSGLTSNATLMDVIGNNISNTNTIGYKVNRGSLSTAFEQTARSANLTVPVGLTVGLGVNVAGTVRQFGQGAFQRTDVPSDLGLQGDGWMTVNTASTGAGVDYITRAGNFVVDSSGYLRTPDGNYLMGDCNGVTIDAAGLLTAAGYVADPLLQTTGVAGFPADRVRIPLDMNTGLGTPPLTAQDRVASYNIAKDGTVTVVSATGSTAVVGLVTVQRYINNNALRHEGNNLFSYNQAAGANTSYAGGYGGAASVQSGVLEMSNVDLAREFSDMILIQRGFDANARTISTSDEMLQTAVNIKR
jgi:flagellar hook protein FlgE